MNISGKTKTYAVLGHPITHTLSPPMHNAALNAMGHDAIYLAYDIQPNDLLATLTSMHTMGFSGANLTLPLKEIAFRELNHLDDSAKLVGAVNTIVFTKNKLTGHSTDGYGLQTAIHEAFNLPLKGQTICIIGTGGAGRAAALHSAAHGAERLLLINRSQDKAQKVADEIHALNTPCQVNVTNLNNHDAIKTCTLVINSTTLGMKPNDPSPLPSQAFSPHQAILDMIYVTPNTPFMQAAAQTGARTANGLSMLLHQGIRSLEIWTGKAAPVDTMRKALTQAIYTT